VLSIPRRRPLHFYILLYLFSLSKYTRQAGTRCSINEWHRSRYGDFRDQLRDRGFAVVKGAIPSERVKYLVNKSNEWLGSFGTGLDFDNPETWLAENLPIQNAIVRSYAGYCLPHEKFMWEARMEPGVLDAFAKLWGTDELLVSFDGINITFPNRKDLAARKPWQHIDQGPSKRGCHCVQGIIHLSHSGPEDGGLTVVPESHKLHDEFLRDHPHIKPYKNKDIYIFSSEELEWFKARGMTAYKVCVEPGDLIMWDSRTIHWGADPTEKGETIRRAIYATYMPAKLASKEQLAQKKYSFENFGSTTHWPFEHLGSGRTIEVMPDGTVDPREREKPREMPEMSDQLLKLGGVKTY
jgi:ectoine hydroxylase-related dioxygenase (phytanoyl-CoA dioxygenase family)